MDPHSHASGNAPDIDQVLRSKCFKSQSGGVIRCHHQVSGYDFHRTLYPHLPRTSRASLSRCDWQVTRTSDNLSQPTRSDGYIIPGSGCAFYSQKSISSCAPKLTLPLLQNNERSQGWKISYNTCWHFRTTAFPSWC